MVPDSKGSVTRPPQESRQKGGGLRLNSHGHGLSTRMSSPTGTGVPVTRPPFKIYLPQWRNWPKRQPLARLTEDHAEFHNQGSNG